VVLHLVHKKKSPLLVHWPQHIPTLQKSIHLLVMPTTQPQLEGLHTTSSPRLDVQG